MQVSILDFDAKKGAYMKAKYRYIRLLMMVGAAIFALVLALTACTGEVTPAVTTDADTLDH